MPIGYGSGMALMHYHETSPGRFSIRKRIDGRIKSIGVAYDRDHAERICAGIDPVPLIKERTPAPIPDYEKLCSSAAEALIRGWRTPITDAEIASKPHLYYR